MFRFSYSDVGIDITFSPMDHQAIAGQLGDAPIAVPITDVVYILSEYPQ
jgi:hypothetical protein